MRTLRAVDVGLEFAHVQITKDSFPEKEVRISARYLRRIIKGLDSKGQTWSVCILIDNKHSRFGLREIAPFLAFAATLVPRLDFICFEKALPRYKEKLFDILTPERRDHVIAEMYRYAKKHKSIACSHDIALWHLIRLGVINNLDGDTIVPVGVAGHRHAISHVAQRIVSVLSEHDKRFEDKAVSDILQFTTDRGIPDKIKRIYY